MPVRGCSSYFAAKNSVVTDVLMRVHAFIKCGEVDEGFEDGPYLASGVGGTVVFRVVGISTTYDGDDASGVVLYANECPLDILWVSSVIALDVAILGMSLVKLEIGWLSLDISEVFLECLLSIFLEFEVERGPDGEASHLDVVFL